ncbi:uncharacterized protein J7T54_003874 [Emericellopsis cladophorae]|uniref:Uncharacterized protein n=1 Tax=Emericellopsis cladophorae TaxID=2686198 RepID=A0A9P9XWP0_9HYPO|nr:uncharacterized protein J7T54_003874 [Emericellopsis cladophorae]KAI6778938.1 hypothetical protein J7T54_003874 [Emericellopsis cladophorae]
MSLEQELLTIIDKELAQNPRARGFKDFHSNGLPILDDPAVIESYRAEAEAPELIDNDVPSSFYTHVPPGSAALFSRNGGRRPFRFMQHFLPERRVFHWSVSQVHSVCKSLARKQWRAVMQVKNKRPDINTQLYDYFDSYDLYHYGAVNLANVLAGISNIDLSNLQRVEDSLKIAHLVFPSLPACRNMTVALTYNVF